jgi:hypothetical protein
MANLKQMSRVLHNHVWDDVRQWAAALEHLADLNDFEIAVLAVPDRPHCPPPRRVHENSGGQRCGTGAAESNRCHEGQP